MSPKQENREGVWESNTIVITGAKVDEFNRGAPEGLHSAPVVDKAGTTIGNAERYVDSGPNGVPELFVTPTDAVYQRMGEERGGNTLGIPAEQVALDRASNTLKVAKTLDEIFAMNRERGGRPQDVDVATELGTEPRE